jgi:hypothetical protein
MMYDTLGGKVDSLSEADLLGELEKIATVKTGTEVQAEDYPAMITMKNPVQQPTHTHDQPTLAMGNIVNMAINPPITELYYQYPVRISEENPIQQPITHRSPAHTHNQPALAERTANTTMDSAITKPCYQTHTDKTLADQCRLMTAIASTSMNSAATKLCYKCSEVTHADKVLADQCRLMTAILGEGWGRLSSKPMDMSKVAREPMAKHGDDGNDDPDEDTSAEVTEETEENNSKAWTALRPTKPNRNGAATELKLNSNSTRGPTQDLLQDKTSTKSWHKTNTELALDEVQTETDEPDNDKEATGTDTVRKDVTSDEPDHNTPKADEGAFAATI